MVHAELNGQRVVASDVHTINGKQYRVVEGQMVRASKLAIVPKRKLQQERYNVR